MVPCYSGPVSGISLKQAVHKNVDVSDIQKFTYLKSFLVGDAERAIQGLTLTKENYAHAVETLTSRFGNKQARIAAHMKELRTLKLVNNMNDVIIIGQYYY